MGSSRRKVVEMNKKKTIDLVGFNQKKNQVNLLLLDQRTWEDPKEHIDRIQERILAYVKYVEDGSFIQDYPQMIGVEIIIRVVFKYVPTDEGMSYIEEAQSVLSDTGYHLEFMNYDAL